jgi:hypothetical protein
VKTSGEKQKSAVDAALCLVGSWKKPASAGYRPFPSIASKKKKPLDPCGVVRGVITKVPFSLLLSAEERQF